jgi:hypothetical protein
LCNRLICQIWTSLASIDSELASAQNGGSARGYQELSTLLAIPATAEQAGGQPVCFMHRQRWV